MLQQTFTLVRVTFSPGGIKLAPSAWIHEGRPLPDTQQKQAAEDGTKRQFQPPRGTMLPVYALAAHWEGFSCRITNGFSKLGGRKRPNIHVNSKLASDNGIYFLIHIRGSGCLWRRCRTEVSEWERSLQPCSACGWDSATCTAAGDEKELNLACLTNPLLQHPQRTLSTSAGAISTHRNS